MVDRVRDAAQWRASSAFRWSRQRVVPAIRSGSRHISYDNVVPRSVRVPGYRGMESNMALQTLR